MYQFQAQLIEETSYEDQKSPLLYVCVPVFTLDRTQATIGLELQTLPQ